MKAVALKTTVEDEIRAFMDRYYEAIRSGDVARIVAHYAPDIVAFDAIARLRFEGRDAYKAHWEACFAMCEGMTEPVFEMHDLSVSAGDGVAFGHYLVRCGGTDASGETKVGWMRATVGLERRDGRWAIVHEHYSAPFDMASGKALLDLEP